MKFRACLVAMAFVFGCLTAQAAEDIATGLITAYNFEAGSGTTVEDVAGSNDGTVSGTEFSTTAKNGTYSMDFSGDASRDHVDMGTMDIPGSACTIMMWFNTRGFSGTNGDQRLISKNFITGTGQQDHIWMISGWRDHNLRFRLKTGTDALAGSSNLITGTTGAPKFADNEWVHVACTYDGANIAIYINGASAATAPQTGDIYQDATVPAYLGDTTASSTTAAFNGFIDDVRIYSRALNLAEITEAMNTPVGLAGPAPGIEVRDGATVIPNNGELDLGAPAKDEVVSKTITVKNTGDAQLTLGTPTVPAGWTIAASDPLEGTVEAGLETTFTVDLDTSSEGVKDGAITIDTNVTGTDPFTFTIKANVGATEVEDWNER